MKELKSCNIEIDWTENLNKAWCDDKRTLAHAARDNLARFDSSKEISIVCDASDDNWAAVVLQSEPLGDRDRKHVDVIVFEPLAYLQTALLDNKELGTSAKRNSFL